MATENAVKLYWDCANALDSRTHCHQLLKSHYMTTCRKLARHNLQLPKEKFAASRMCPRCSSQWGEVEFQLKARPQQVASTAKARKLIAKLEEMQNSKKRGLLTKKQCRRAKWLKKRAQSSVEIQCEFCQHKTRLSVEKPTKSDAQIEQADAVEELSTKPTKLKKKKNKKKQKTAGLTLKKVPAKTEEKKQEPRTLNSKKPPTVTVTSLGAKIKNVFKTKATNATTSAGLAKIVKTNKKKRKAAKTAASPVALKVQSKTQQQNSLLQLAALLKTQASKSAAQNTTQKRLESLLK